MKNIQTTLLLIVLLSLNSCLQSPVFQSSRINNGSAIRVNTSGTVIKGVFNDIELEGTQSNYDNDTDERVYDTIRTTVNSFQQQALHISLLYEKTFFQEFSNPKFQFSGILVPFLVFNYGELNLKVQFLQLGENGLFSNISASAFGGFQVTTLAMNTFYVGANGGLSVGTFYRKGSHEIELATNVQNSTYYSEAHQGGRVKYRSYLIGLGSGYTFWKEGGAKFYSVELGAFYNFSRSYKGYEYVAYSPISYSVDGGDINTTGIPFTISLCVKGGF